MCRWRTARARWACWTWWPGSGWGTCRATSPSTTASRTPRTRPSRWAVIGRLTSQCSPLIGRAGLRGGAGPHQRRHQAAGAQTILRRQLRKILLELPTEDPYHWHPWDVRGDLSICERRSLGRNIPRCRDYHDYVRPRWRVLAKVSGPLLQLLVTQYVQSEISIQIKALLYTALAPVTFNIVGE